jgi:hypothetical protein
LRALEDFSQGIGLMPEQIWDGPDLPNYYLRFGGTTDAAMPLLWAQSEYVKLHRSAADGQVFDLVEAAFERYVKGSGERKNHGSLEAESSGPNGTGLHAPADTSELSVSIALDERRLATFERCEVTRNSDWD